MITSSDFSVLTLEDKPLDFVEVTPHHTVDALHHESMTPKLRLGARPQ
jgi:hypothetical protein